MLETGLAIIALKLPTIWGLITRTPIKSVLSKLRNMMSLTIRTSHNDRPAYNEISNLPKAWKGSKQDDRTTKLLPQPRHFVTIVVGDLRGEEIHLSKPR